MVPIDLRSDTTTKPTPSMRRAMYEAPLGDDVFGEDPTVNELESVAAAMLGKEAAIFASSGTQSNLLGLMSHCQRGDEYICGDTAHAYRYEGGGGAVLGSIQPQPVTFEPDGCIDLEKIRNAVKPDDVHFAQTRLLCLENTTEGRVLPMQYLHAARGLCDELGLAMHLDGARVFNAATKLNVAVSEIASPFDSVSVCLSKGLGAPVGSVLCGSQTLISRARRIRKMLGGGMRQAGVIAAGGLVALRENVSRLADDHTHARRLAEGLAENSALDVDPNQVQTNMVFVSADAQTMRELARYLHEHDILIADGAPARLVTHLDVSAADIERVIERVGKFFHNAKQKQKQRQGH